MAVLELRQLTKTYGDFNAVDEINLTVKDGEIVTLLGESGCGKTTTLRMIAGFTAPTGGQVLIDDQSVNDIPAYKRRVGIFFQNYALFPHLSTFENIAFGLRLQKLPGAEVAKRVAQMLEMVKLTGLEKRFPREISGGQQQRVALARALVTEPKVLLLDEPLSNLDAKLRAEMQLEIRRIQRDTGVTTIMVTHDQDEAISIADRLVVMNKGRILQTGSPKEVFDSPADSFVADFMGFTNFIPGVLQRKENGSATALCGNAELALDAASCGGLQHGQAVTLAIRPEGLELHGEPAPGLHPAVISQVTYKGNVSRVEITGLFERPLFAHTQDTRRWAPGEVFLGFPPERLRVYPADNI